jgi:hypothetical protein
MLQLRSFERGGDPEHLTAGRTREIPALGKEERKVVGPKAVWNMIGG